MVVVGLPPTSDVQALQNLYFARKFEGSGRLRSALSGQNQCRIEPNLEPQVQFFCSLDVICEKVLFIKANNILPWISGLVCLPSRKATATKIQGSPFFLLSKWSRGRVKQNTFKALIIFILLGNFYNFNLDYR